MWIVDTEPNASLASSQWMNFASEILLRKDSDAAGRLPVGHECACHVLREIFEVVRDVHRYCMWNLGYAENDVDEVVDGSDKLWYSAPPKTSP